MNRDNIVCPSCYNVGLIKKGFDRKNRQRWKCKVCGVKTITPIADESELELLTENVKLAKQKQSAQDLNRIERKAFREHVRVENAVSNLLSEFNRSPVRATTIFLTPAVEKYFIAFSIKSLIL